MTSTDPIRLERLIRGATTRRGVLSLLRELGFRPRALSLHPSDVGLQLEDGIVGVDRLAVRGCLDALWIRVAGELTPDAAAAHCRRVRAHAPSRWSLLVLTSPPPGGSLTLASHGLDGVLRHLTLDAALPRSSDVEALAEMVAAPGEEGLALVQRYARALDRTRVTRRFFADFRAHRAALAAAWTGIPCDARSERDQLALLQLCRLMFLYFLQRGGHLTGDPEYLRGLLRRIGGTHGTFFRAVLQPLFFGALNTKPEQRSADASRLGPLPYLNGGLFERHALEHRFGELDLPDEPVRSAMDDFLERYRFTPREAADAAVGGGVDLGVDPEMLGRVFEGLMAPERRVDTGTFYTPAPVVDRLVRESLATWIGGRTATCGSGSEAARADALRNVRVLDPACGSGAFLLGALARISAARLEAEGGTMAAAAVRREVLAGSLYGVDLQEDAALLCALRLWLAVSIGSRPDELLPLPNLDRRIRQGDTLLDPLDLLRREEGDPDWRSGAADPTVRHAVARITALGSAYVAAEPESRAGIATQLQAQERALAREWLTRLERRARHDLAEAESRAHARDLFGETGREARRAAVDASRHRRRLGEVAQMRLGLEDGGAAPFFSFDVHFADARADGFDLVLSNPPWVRSHRWPAAVAKLVRARSEICRSAGVDGRSVEKHGRSGGQVDLALLFLERALRLLAPGGVAGMVLPAKLLRSLYAGPARAILLRDAEIVFIEDHSLDQRSIFRADAFTVLLVARRRPAALATGATPETVDSGVFQLDGVDNSRRTNVIIMRRGGGSIRFSTAPDDLPLIASDTSSPWLLVPEAVRAAVRRMQAAGPPLGGAGGLQVRRGAETGGNRCVVLREVRRGLGDLTRFRAEGWWSAPAAGARARYRGVVESAAVRPLVRGTDIRAWRCRTERWLLAPPDPLRLPPRAAAYLASHGLAAPVSPEQSGAVRVAWRDIGRTLEAVVLPSSDAVPLNTVYFVELPDTAAARRLCALLNSLPVRVFARSIAERAKDAHFRFFAWTISLLPLPGGWAGGPAAGELEALAKAAEAGEGLTAEEAGELDRVVACLYGLDPGDLEALGGFDEWLSGRADDGVG